jgi:pimeloyl-ACP methyl ester carboxylesterase
VLTDDGLARVERPVLFVWGDRAPFGDVAVAQRAAALMPRARVEVITDARHHPWPADPARAADRGSSLLATAGHAHDSP